MLRFFVSHFCFPASGQAVVTGVVPSFPRFSPSIFMRVYRTLAVNVNRFTSGRSPSRRLWTPYSIVHEKIHSFFVVVGRPRGRSYDAASGPSGGRSRDLQLQSLPPVYDGA